jgi:hypothetical protein
MLEYYILKQLIPNADIWVASLGEGDPIYKYPSQEEAEVAIIELQPSYPDHKLKISAAA